MQSLTKDIGRIFQPLLDAFGGILAFFYSIVPNYPIDVALLTIVIMALLTPLTVKSTKSMAAMQAIGPEVKKLQQKYKGDRVQLNEELMKLYKEHGVNPVSGCLPMLLQMPAFFILYSVIRGMTNTVTHSVCTTTLSGAKACHPVTVAEPRYIPVHSKMYEDIVAAHGQLNSFGMNFADRLLSHHSSIWAAIPFLLLVAGAVGLQYLQMARLNARNPQAAQANPQQAMLQKYMPLIFGFIYINVAAILNVYFIVSSAIRILTQEVLFRRGIAGVPPSPTAEAEVPDKRPKPPVVDRSERALPRPKGSTSTGGGNGARRPGSAKTTTGGTSPSGGQARPKARPGAKPGSGKTQAKPKGTTPERGASGGRSGTNGSGPSRSGQKGSRSNGSNGRTSGGGATGDTPAPKAHPRSKDKRERKAR